MERNMTPQKMRNRSSAGTGPMQTEAPPHPEVRREVRDLLLKSKSFTQLPPATQQQIAHDMAQIADYLVAPEGIPGNKLPTAEAQSTPVSQAMDSLYTAAPSPAASTYREDRKAVSEIGQSKFEASAAREGAEVAGALLKQVNFPTFCASLIKGVFHAIVEASIEQMEAYGKLVASVAQSLNTFRDENVSDNQGRDHLVDQFPDMFEIGSADGGDGFGGGGGGPRVKLRDGVDEDSALK